MWEYTDKVKEHFKNPKNVGSIDNADAIGEAGSLACGDMLKLYLKIDNKGIVTDAKFQTFGCGSAIASSSVLTEMVIGKHIDEVKKITNQDIVDELGGLPPEKIHCSVMGHEALEDALKNYFGNDEKSENVNDVVICKCFGITESFLKNEIKEHNLKTLEDVMKYTKAGTGCGLCKDKIKTYLSNNIEQSNSEKLSNVQFILKVNNVIDKYISNELRKDGGDIELVDIVGNKVYVKLSGSCHACTHANLTLKNFVETTLREHISSDIIVEKV